MKKSSRILLKLLTLHGLATLAVLALLPAAPQLPSIALLAVWCLSFSSIIILYSAFGLIPVLEQMTD